MRSLDRFRRPKLYTCAVALLAYLFDINRNFKNKIVVFSANQTTTIRIVPTQTLLDNRQLFLDLALTSSIAFQYMPLVLLVLFNILLVTALAKHSFKMKSKFGGKDNGETGETSGREPFPGHNKQQIEVVGKPKSPKSHQRNLTRNLGDGVSSSLQRQKSATRTVLVYSFIFTVLSLPYTFYPLLRRVIPGFDVYDREHYLVMSLGNVFVLLDTVSSAMNFFIYFSTGSAFRAGVFRLLRSGQSKKVAKVANYGESTAVTADSQSYL
ncbi:hypothetical protein BaRGS_00021800 [Batillaria attramentaria]|uniref:G-protein coupled receptors family 1 profile domain-containing protein n=1 Tax=Batillaria attramentaria TaxID=370345 RepID=A0ABD0KIV8_9CAEN